MTIEENRVVSINYTLKDNDGKILDSSDGREPLTYLHGKGNIIPGLENELVGLKTGDKKAVTVEPANGYGERNDAAITQLPKAELAQIPNLEAGMQIQAQTKQGVQILTVLEVTDDTVSLDANHPLAGVTLNFDVEVVEVRDATADEMSHGHAHGPGGAHH